MRELYVGAAVWCSDECAVASEDRRSRRGEELQGPGSQTGFATNIPSTGKVTQSPGRLRVLSFPSLNDTLQVRTGSYGTVKRHGRYRQTLLAREARVRTQPKLMSQIDNER